MYLNDVLNANGQGHFRRWSGRGAKVTDDAQRSSRYDFYTRNDGIYDGLCDLMDFYDSMI